MIIPLYLSSQDNFTPLVPPLLLARSIRTTNSFSRHNLSWTTSFYLSLSRRYPCFTIDILTHVSFNQERSNCLIYLVHFIIVHSTYRRILVSVRLLATYITIYFIHLSYNNRSILLARPLFRVTRLAARDNRAVSPLLLLLLRRRGMYTWHDGTRGIDYYWAGTCTMPTRFVQRATIHYPINRGRLIVEGGGDCKPLANKETTKTTRRKSPRVSRLDDLASSWLRRPLGWFTRTSTSGKLFRAGTMEIVRVGAIMDPSEKNLETKLEAKLVLLFIYLFIYQE